MRYQSRIHAATQAHLTTLSSHTPTKPLQWGISVRFFFSFVFAFAFAFGSRGMQDKDKDKDRQRTVDKGQQGLTPKAKPGYTTKTQQSLEHTESQRKLTSTLSSPGIRLESVVSRRSVLMPSSRIRPVLPGGEAALRLDPNSAEQLASVVYGA